MFERLSSTSCESYVKTHCESYARTHYVPSNVKDSDKDDGAQGIQSVAV